MLELAPRREGWAGRGGWGADAWARLYRWLTQERSPCSRCVNIGGQQTPRTDGIPRPCYYSPCRCTRIRNLFFIIECAAIIHCSCRTPSWTHLTPWLPVAPRSGRYRLTSQPVQTHVTTDTNVEVSTEVTFDTSARSAHCFRYFTVRLQWTWSIVWNAIDNGTLDCGAITHLRFGADSWFVGEGDLGGPQDRVLLQYRFLRQVVSERLKTGLNRF